MTTPGTRKRPAPHTPSIADKPAEIPGSPEEKPEGKPELEEKPELVCGKLYERKVKGGQIKEYPCTKASGHEGKCGRKRSDPVDTSSVSMELLDTFEAVPGTEIVPVREAEVIRDEKQLKVDAQVKSAHESWIIGGRKKSFNDSPRQRYRISNRKEGEMLITMLRRAERFLGDVHVRIAPISQHKDGYLVLSWVAMDAKPKANGNESEAAKTESETVKAG